MRITVIGGSGFVGTRLVKRLLDAGHIVRIGDKSRSGQYGELHKYCDVRERETLDEVVRGAEVVINLAAEHRDDVRPKSLYDEVNVDGARNVCDACRATGVKRIVFTSSVAVYGFAPRGTTERGEINYFNDYGRTKWLAEEVYREWAHKEKGNGLTIVRPTVIFGEGNRGNVYNLLKQMAGGRFVMVGKGRNVKSMAYVENAAAFIEYAAVKGGEGEHIYNYVDKPDFDMNGLVGEVYRILGRDKKSLVHWPYWLGYFGGLCFDGAAAVLKRRFAVSAIRVKKFCSDTMFSSENVGKTGFAAPVGLARGLENTVRYEFIENRAGQIFYTE